MHRDTVRNIQVKKYRGQQMALLLTSKRLKIGEPCQWNNDEVWKTSQFHTKLIHANNNKPVYKLRNLLLSKLLHTKRLALLGLKTLKLRRIRFDLTKYFKFLNNLTTITPSIILDLHLAHICFICKNQRDVIQSSHLPFSTYIYRPTS
jgi:hypothetical protein